MFIHRTIEFNIKKHLSIFPAIGITGPRQSGKSTLLKNMLPEYRYVSFDDYQAKIFLDTDPIGFMNHYSNKVIFDEVQKAPIIFDMIKNIIDNNRDINGNFILTGSSQFSMIRGIKESLAGRIGLLQLLPFERSEIPRNLRDPSIYKGSYPGLVTRDYNYNNEWYSSYIETYINKDVKDISNLGNLRDFRKFVLMLASQATQILNMSSYAKDLGVSVPTIKSWISILEASYIIYLLPPFYNNLGKRIIKAPKVYFYDTGLISYLKGIETEKQYNSGPMSRAIFENYIITEIIKSSTHNGRNEDYYFLRTQNGEEVDLIVDNKTEKTFIKIKKSSTFKTDYMKAITAFKRDTDKGYVIYSGEDIALSDSTGFRNYNGFLMT